MSNYTCDHPVVIQAKTKGQLSDEDVRVYYCINPNCAKPVIAMPINKFDNDEEAKAYLKKVVSEIEIPRLSTPQGRKEREAKIIKKG